MKLIPLLLAALLPCSACSGKEDVSEMTEQSSESQDLAIIGQYVVKQKGWDKSLFRIEEKRRENGNVVYLILYLPEEKAAFIGGGESFLIYYDPIKREIVKEMYFQ